MSAGIADVLYVRFQIEDLDQQRRFLEDFGFEVSEIDGRLLARGTDPNPFVYIAEPAETNSSKFLGFAFETLSYADLERIAAIDNVQIEPLELPGGGAVAHLTDPDGYLVDVVYGFGRPAALTPPNRQPINTGTQRRRLGERVSYSDQPVQVKRLGHVVLNTTDFRTSEAWYKNRFGLLTSDEVVMPSPAGGQVEQTIGAFMRINRGELPVDHHTLFLVHAGKADFNHAAFEVADWDTLMLGHDHLQQQGYEHRWGIGKHVLGSQVFDYWKDPAGFSLEHFTDGDLFNETWGSHKASLDALLDVHWGPRGAPS